MLDKPNPMDELAEARVGIEAEQGAMHRLNDARCKLEGRIASAPA